MPFQSRDKRATGYETYGDERELGEPKEGGRSDWLSWSGYGPGEVFTKAGITVIAAITIIGALAGGIAKYQVYHPIDFGSGRASKLDPELREQSVEIAQRLQSLLGGLSERSSYIQDPESGKFKLTPQEALFVQPMMDSLKSSWPGAIRSKELQVVENLLKGGATPKEIYTAYDGLARKYNKRVDFEKENNKYDDLSAFSLPKAHPDLETKTSK